MSLTGGPANDAPSSSGVKALSGGPFHPCIYARGPRCVWARLEAKYPIGAICFERRLREETAEGREHPAAESGMRRREAVKTQRRAVKRHPFVVTYTTVPLLLIT